MKEVTIWSIMGCPACRHAKMFFMQNNIKYEEKLIGENCTPEEFKIAFPNHRTFPQIVIDGKHIGGYTDLLEYSRNN